MKVPVRLYRRGRDGAIVEMLDPGESGALLYGQGTELVESVAEVSGVAAYLRHREMMIKAVVPVEGEEKAVSQSAVEDKTVDKEEVEDKGIIQDRSRGRRST